MTKTIEIPAQTIEFNEGPVTVEHALDNTNEHGHFEATLRLPVSLLTSVERDYDSFYDSLCDALIIGALPYSVSFNILAIDPEDKHYAFVRVSNDVVEMVLSEPDFGWDIPEGTIERIAAEVAAQFPA